MVPPASGAESNALTGQNNRPKKVSTTRIPSAGLFGWKCGVLRNRRGANQLPSDFLGMFAQGVSQLLGKRGHVLVFGGAYQPGTQIPDVIFNIHGGCRPEDEWYSYSPPTVVLLLYRIVGIFQ